MQTTLHQALLRRLDHEGSDEEPAEPPPLPPPVTPPVTPREESERPQEDAAATPYF